MSLMAGRPSRSKKPATLADMSDKSEKVRVNFDIDRELHKKLKMYALEQGKSIREVLDEQIRVLVASR